MLLLLMSPIAIAGDEGLNLPKIFVYTLPDDTSTEEDISPDDMDAPESDYINEIPEHVVDSVGEDVLEEINLSDIEEDDTPIVAATTLKGYAEYVEDTESIYLTDEDGQFVLNLKVPQKIGASSTLDLSRSINGSHNNKPASKYIKEEHTVADRNIESVMQAGDFKFGTAFGQEVDNISMLENSTSLFTKYEREKFSIGSKFEKTMNTTIGTFSDVLSFEPEYKLNNYISIKEVLKANFSKNRKSSELILSISPYGRHKGDRLRLEFGARYTVNQDNSFYGTQLNFSTKFKL